MKKFIKITFVFILVAALVATMSMSWSYLRKAGKTHIVTYVNESTNTAEICTYEDYDVFGHIVSIKMDSETVEFQTMSK